MTAKPGPRLGYPGLALTLIGSVALLISFTWVNWYAGTSGADGISDIGFNDLHQNLAAFSAPAASTSYFGWIAWTLLIIVLLLGVGANLPNRAADSLRIAGLAVGLIGSAWTYYALAQYIQALHDRGATNAGVFTRSESGIWLAMVGYLFAGIGAALGPLPIRSVLTPRSHA
ncbi:MAG: hypothetical protein ABI232_06650 [Jatrophihabitantaceae bacterium]